METVVFLAEVEDGDANKSTVVNRGGPPIVSHGLPTPPPPPSPPNSGDVSQ